jgi:hypothetical protein
MAPLQLENVGGTSTEPLMNVCIPRATTLRNDPTGYSRMRLILLREQTYWHGCRSSELKALRMATCLLRPRMLSLLLAFSQLKLCEIKFEHPSWFRFTFYDASCFAPFSELSFGLI